MTTNQNHAAYGKFFSRHLEPYRSDVPWGWLRQILLAFILGVVCTTIVRHVFGS